MMTTSQRGVFRTSAGNARILTPLERKGDLASAEQCLYHAFINVGTSNLWQRMAVRVSAGGFV